MGGANHCNHMRLAKESNVRHPRALHQMHVADCTCRLRVTTCSMIKHHLARAGWAKV